MSGLLDMAAGTLTGTGTVAGTSSCIIEWPYGWYGWPTQTVPGTYVAPAQPDQHTHYHFAQRLSDEDVDRIARRVAELLKPERKAKR